MCHTLDKCIEFFRLNSDVYFLIRKHLYYKNSIVVCLFVCLFVCPDCIKVMWEYKPHLQLR